MFPHTEFPLFSQWPPLLLFLLLFFLFLCSLNSITFWPVWPAGGEVFLYFLEAGGIFHSVGSCTGFLYLILTDELLVRDVSRQVRVQQGTESQAIAPAAAEVGHIDILLTEKSIYLLFIINYQQEKRRKPQDHRMKSQTVIMVTLKHP